MLDSLINKGKELLGWDVSENEELLNLKKEMAWRVLDKMQEKKWDILLSLKKDMVVDYLVDEWANGFIDWILDSISDELILDKVVNISSFSQQLKDLRDNLSKVTTQAALNDLETRVINQLEWNVQDMLQDSWSESVSQQWEWEASVDDNTSEWESLEGSAQVGEAKEVEKNQRMKRLFPEWVPQTEKEMRKYLTKIKVPIITEKWKEKKLTLRVHKKLAKEYIAIFEDMKASWIKVNPDTTACFNWRKMRKGSKMSHHSYWTAIDVNWDVNGGVYWKTDKNSPYFNDQACVNIRKKHGFYWWWDWKPSNNDPMHFTYMNA